MDLLWMIHDSFSLFRLIVFYSVTLILNLYFYTVSWVCLWIAFQMRALGRMPPLCIGLCIGDACAAVGEHPFLMQPSEPTNWSRDIHIFQRLDSDTDPFSWSSQYESTCTQGITALISFDPVAFMLK